MLDTLLSIVLVTQNAQATIAASLEHIRTHVAPLVSDYEIIIVDNASRDATLDKLEEATQTWPNIQVYCFAAAIDIDAARLAGLEQAIGDYTLVFDPYADDLQQFPTMLDHATKGAQLVTARKRRGKPHGSMGYRMSSYLFLKLFRKLSGYHLRKDAPHFRLMTRRLVNFVLQHDNAYVTYQLLPVSAGFTIRRIVYDGSHMPPRYHQRTVFQMVDHAIALMVTSSNAPLRLVTYSCALAGMLSLLFSLYAVLIYFFKKNVAPGWTTLSLQFSAQFFLLALAIALLAEYVLQIGRQTNKRPKYYIVREFRSNQITRELKLNLKKTE